MTQKSVTLYYYWKAWIIIVHDYVILNAFEIIQKLREKKSLDCSPIEMFSSILYLLFHSKLFQMSSYYTQNIFI